MTTADIATISTPSPAIFFRAVDGLNFVGAACASAVRHLRRAVSRRKEALVQRMEDVALEMLAAIVLIAIFVIMTEPTARNDG